ncbi:unnamed protein product [Brassica oleracea var. botrytis]
MSNDIAIACAGHFARLHVNSSHCQWKVKFVKLILLRPSISSRLVTRS